MESSITPPVNPKIFSKSTGVSTSLPTILSLNPGAYSSTILKTVLAYFSLKFGSSQEPFSGEYGVNWVNSKQTCAPSGHKVGSKLEGITSSIMGRSEG